MSFRRLAGISATILLLAGSALAQDSQAPPPAPAGPVIRTETKVVLVDAVVTDKKGKYIRDLTAKDFKVWEDKQEQAITSFAFESDANSPVHNQPQYMVLFFDNSTMNNGDQILARQAAIRFVDANAAPNRMIAVVDFGGTLRVAQNFTKDAVLLKKVISGVKFSTVSPNPEVASMGMPPISAAETDFGARDLILAIRSLSKNLGTVPGRKTLVLLSAGFPLTPLNTPELMPEITAAIDTCNKANVAIYPIDVRGLVADVGMATPPTQSAPGFRTRSAGLLSSLFSGIAGAVSGATLQPASFSSDFMGQRGGGGSGGGIGGGSGGVGGGGGGRGGGSTGGGTGGGTSGGRGSGGTGGGTGSGRGTGSGTGSGGSRGTGGGSTNNANSYNNPLNPLNQPRMIVPTFPNSAATNQQILYMLAAGTGGFVIVNSNDLLAGMQKIASEQNEYYLIGYRPPDSEEGSCHQLHVKVDQSGLNVRARSGYCNVRPQDMLAGNPVEKTLEARAAGGENGTLGGAMQLPFFYTGANTARVNIAMDIPTGQLKFEKEKGKLHCALNVLGLALRADGQTAARFSDTLDLEVKDKKELEAFRERPLHYENQFDIASGTYRLRVAFSSASDSFGKLELPLVIDPWNSKELAISGLALSTDVHPVSADDVTNDSALMEGRTPLVVKGLQIVPSGTELIHKTDKAGLYLEVYDPLLTTEHPPQVGVVLRIVDPKTGQVKTDTGPMPMASMIRQGSPVIPVGLRLPIENLTPGTYNLEIKAVDSTGKATGTRTTEFVLQ